MTGGVLLESREESKECESRVCHQLEGRSKAAKPGLKMCTSSRQRREWGRCQRRMLVFVKKVMKSASYEERQTFMFNLQDNEEAKTANVVSFFLGEVESTMLSVGQVVQAYLTWAQGCDDLTHDEFIQHILKSWADAKEMSFSELCKMEQVQRKLKGCPACEAMLYGSADAPFSIACTEAFMEPSSLVSVGPTWPVAHTEPRTSPVIEPSSLSTPESGNPYPVFGDFAEVLKEKALDCHDKFDEKTKIESQPNNTEGQAMIPSVADDDLNEPGQTISIPDVAQDHTFEELILDENVHEQELPWTVTEQPGRRPATYSPPMSVIYNDLFDDEDNHCAHTTDREATETVENANDLDQASMSAAVTPNCPQGLENTNSPIDQSYLDHDLAFDIGTGSRQMHSSLWPVALAPCVCTPFERDAEEGNYTSIHNWVHQSQMTDFSVQIVPDTPPNISFHRPTTFGVPAQPSFNMDINTSLASTLSQLTSHATHLGNPQTLSLTFDQPQQAQEIGPSKFVFNYMSFPTSNTYNSPASHLGNPPTLSLTSDQPHQAQENGNSKVVVKYMSFSNNPPDMIPVWQNCLWRSMVFSQPYLN